MEETKLGAWATGFSLFKGFVGTGILYMPANFITAGWGFSTFTLILAAALTIIAAKLLIETREKLGGNLSYPDIGMKLYGTKGRVAVEVSIVGSQFTLVAAYIYFIAFTLQSILFNAFAITISKWAFGALCFAIYTPLCLVRDMATLASTHLFGDIMIILTVLSIMTYAFLAMGEPDRKTANEPFINTTLFPNAFGFSVFAYCGMGTVLPTYDMTADKKNYFKVLCYVCITIMVIYIVFPLVCINAYGVYNGNKLSPVYNAFGVSTLITSSLTHGYLACLIQLMFILNLIFSYPLVINPANLVIESYLFKKMPEGPKKKWSINFSRAVMVLGTILCALIIWESLNMFLSVAGALACTPLCFILPAVFHYKACAETKNEKRFDMFLIIACTFIMVFCTIWGIGVWVMYEINLDNKWSDLIPHRQN